MKRTVKYEVNGKLYKRKVKYIPMRFIIAVLIGLISTLLVIAVAVMLFLFVPYSYILLIIIHFSVVIQIIASENNPDFKIPWLVLVLCLPIVGFMLYWMFAQRKLRKKFVKRLNTLRSVTYKHDDVECFKRLSGESSVACTQAKYICKIANSHAFIGTAQRYFSCGEDMFKAMCEDLQNAEKFIFMEYFIIEQGIFWTTVLQILEEKVRQGVEVRVVYDDIGCMMTLPGNYVRKLNKAGIKATVFSRLKGKPDSEFNNRSHRKITVIDGKIGYTGGVNLADEYINAVERFGHWKDGGLRLEGQAVCELTKLFMTDYYMNAESDDTSDREYFTECARTDDKGVIIPFGDGPRPIYDRCIGKTVIQNILNGATDYAYITTPYLIIDNELCATIENTALRGVTVKIIVPHIPDKKIIFAMTRSYYPRLLKAGVQIYEYEQGFIHLKSYLADGKIGMIGTINLDYRSLVHHFENGVWLYDCDCLSDLKRDMDETLEKCIRIRSESLKPNLANRFFCSLIKIFAPLM